MAIWNRQRKEPSDRHREFIYLDEVSVVSLLAGLQGEIKASVTSTLAQTDDVGITASVANPTTGTGFGSRLSSTRTSSNEVVRRAVVQSTFRDLWRRDVGVLLHDTSAVKRRHRKPLQSQASLDNALDRLKRAKLAVPLSEIGRGDIVEMDVRVEADQFFKMVTIGTTFLELMNGREDLFGVSATDLRQVAPMIEVLKEMSVGLVPIRGLSTSHSVVSIAGQPVVIANELLGGTLKQSARPIELVGFAEADSFWRDLRRTLFSESTFTAYARAEGPALSDPWSPIKIADLLESVSPGLRDEVAGPLERLEVAEQPSAEVESRSTIARYQLTGFARDLQAATGTPFDQDAVTVAIEAALPAMISATSLEDRRRAFEPVAVSVTGADVDRDVLLSTRSNWLDASPPAPVESASAAAQHARVESPVQIEVGFVALYW